MADFTEFEWKQHPDVVMAESNYMGCAYNAAVNYGTGRGIRKMGDLIEAINWYYRTQGKVQLDRLVELGIITGYTVCPPECMVRPGGLFHAVGCENDFNHPVYRERQQRAREVLPGGKSGNAGWYAAQVSLVGGTYVRPARNPLPLDREGLQALLGRIADE